MKNIYALYIQYIYRYYFSILQISFFLLPGQDMDLRRLTPFISITNPNFCIITVIKMWDGWLASLTLWTWVWASSSSWWWTGKPGVLQSMGSQRVGHDWVTELKWTKLYKYVCVYMFVCIYMYSNYLFIFKPCIIPTITLYHEYSCDYFISSIFTY